MSDTVLIVNEFGDIGIDGSLLEGEKAEMIELTGGCICCTLLIDLTVTLRTVIDRLNPRWILIETSGIADPRNIMAALRQEDISGKLTLHQTITVLDADCWEVRSVFGDLFTLQLEAANLLLVNKVDLIPPETVGAYLREIRDSLPRTQIVPTVHCRIDPDVFWFRPETLETQDWPEDDLMKTASLDGHGHEHGLAGPATKHFVTFSFLEDRPVGERCFKKFIEALPVEVFRLKGTIRFPDRTMLLNFVAGKAEWAPWPGDQTNRLVFVGWNISGDETLGRLKQCLAAC